MCTTGVMPLVCLTLPSKDNYELLVIIITTVLQYDASNVSLPFNCVFI